MFRACRLHADPADEVQIRPADRRVNRLFDIRAFDFQYDTGGRAGVTHAAMQSLSSGLVFHLPSRTAAYP